MQSVQLLARHSSDDLPADVLLQKAKLSGSGDSLGDLLEYYRPVLERIGEQKLSRQLRGKVSASEVTQIAMIKASGRFSDFRGETIDEFRSWIVSILEHEITDHARRFLVAQRRSVTREIPITEDIHRDDDRPSQICLAQEEVARLLLVVESLPIELRMIVRMRYQEDLTFAEIGQRLDLPVATARRRWLEAVQLIERSMT